MSNDAEVRKMNLIDLLIDDYDDVEEPPEYACKLWSEDQIRQYFENGGLLQGFPEPKKEICREELKKKFPLPSGDDMKKWFPGLDRSKTKCDIPKMRVVCFTNAGNEENVFTMEGIGARRVSTLLDFCRSNQVEMLAVQLPGRSARKEEPFFKTAQEAAAATLKMIAPFIIDTPFCVIGHSLGTWLSFELLSLMREEGLPMPAQVFLSAFASPSLPEAERPWKVNRGMPDAGFMEECVGWDVNDVVFKEPMWSQYSPMMRADFSLFDEYEYRRAGDAPFDFPITTFFARDDKKIKELMVQGWKHFTTQAFECIQIDGHHLYVMGINEQKDAKIAWYTHITERMGKLPFFN